MTIKQANDLLHEWGLAAEGFEIVNHDDLGWKHSVVMILRVADRKYTVSEWLMKCLLMGMYDTINSPREEGYCTRMQEGIEDILELVYPKGTEK